MNQTAEGFAPWLLPSIKKQLQQSQCTISRSPIAGLDPWASYQRAGLDVEQLKAIEEETTRIQLPKIQRGPRDNTGFKDRAALLAKSFPPERILQASPHKPPKPDIVTEQLFPGGPTFFPSLSVQGNGLGWSDSDSRGETWLGQWVYEFTPPQPGTYQITCFPAMQGTIWGHANDQWWNSKDIKIKLGCDLAFQAQTPGLETNETTVPFFFDPMFYSNETLFYKDAGNITLAPTEFNFPEQLQIQFPVTLPDISPVAFGAVLTAAIYAQGAGAYSGFDLTAGVLLAAWQLLD